MSQKKRYGARLIALCVTYILAISGVMAAEVNDVLDRSATQIRDVSKVALLDIARVGSRLVAVGERGMVILSDDSGITWRQAKSVPVSVSLTSVRFYSKDRGWATGHGGIVLRTEDQGETWFKLLDGKVAASLAMEEAKKHTGAKAQADIARDMTKVAQQFLNDGPDKPFFDIYFQSDNVGYVVGAYGLILTTTDGGNTWQAALNRVENPKGLHLYSIRGTGRVIYIVGEQGLLLKSTDGGRQFTKISTPYAGSYFSVSVAQTGEVIAAGLRGNAITSTDGGATWEKIEFPTPISILALTKLQDGSLIAGNQVGQLYVSRDSGNHFERYGTDISMPISSLVQAASGAIVTVGLRGVHLLSSPNYQQEARK